MCVCIHSACGVHCCIYDVPFCVHVSLRFHVYFGEQVLFLALVRSIRGEDNIMTLDLSVGFKEMRWLLFSWKQSINSYSAHDLIEVN